MGYGRLLSWDDVGWCWECGTEMVVEEAKREEGNGVSALRGIMA